MPIMPTPQKTDAQKSFSSQRPCYGLRIPIRTRQIKVPPLHQLSLANRNSLRTHSRCKVLFKAGKPRDSIWLCASTFVSGAPGTSNFTAELARGLSRIGNQYDGIKPPLEA